MEWRRISYNFLGTLSKNTTKRRKYIFTYICLKLGKSNMLFYSCNVQCAACSVYLTAILHFKDCFWKMHILEQRTNYLYWNVKKKHEFIHWVMSFYMTSQQLLSGRSWIRTKMWPLSFRKNLKWINFIKSVISCINFELNKFTVQDLQDIISSCSIFNFNRIVKQKRSMLPKHGPYIICMYLCYIRHSI